MYNKKLIFRLDEETETRLKLRSSQLGISYAEYIRQLIKADYVVKDTEVITDFKADLKTTIKELNAIGNSLNQLARYCSREKKILETEQWEVRHLVDKLILIFKKM